MQQQERTRENHEEECREFLSRKFGIEADYPTSTANVIKLLTNAEYLVDVAAINDLMARERIIPPKMRAGRREWLAMDVVELLAQLEHDRRWMPLSPKHHHKLTRWELHRQLAAAGQAPPVFTDIEKFSIEELLRLMIEAEQREVREMLWTAINIKLDGLRAKAVEHIKEHVRSVSARN